MIRFSEYKMLKEQNEMKHNKRNYNDILKKMGVMNQFGEVDLINMTKKINEFLESDDNKEKFLKDVEEKNIKGEKVKLRVKDLEPGQTTIYLDQMIKRILDDFKFTKKCLNGKIKDRDILISSDNYIIDGHHRCSSAFILNPDCKIKCTKINLPIEIAIPILNSILKATDTDDQIESGEEKYNIYKLMKNEKLQDKLMSIIEDVIDGKKKKEKKMWKLFDRISPETLTENIKKLPNPDNDLAEREDMPQLKNKVEDVIKEY